MSKDFNPSSKTSPTKKRFTEPVPLLPNFRRLSIEQRLSMLARTFGLDEAQVRSLRDGNALTVDQAVNMVENTIGVFGLPLGIATNLLVNGREHMIPIAVEEPSIIAALSKAAHTLRKGGGLAAEADEPIMIGEVQVVEVRDVHKAAQAVKRHADEIVAEGDEFAAAMVARGGGVRGVEVLTFDDDEPFLVVHLLMDVREAMGANAVNGLCEHLAPMIASFTGGRANVRILSNYATRRLARASFRLPLEHLSTDELDGAEVGRRLHLASRLAYLDVYRAVTHNKGFFNGAAACALALGQDWRALEAGGHAYAARDGRYRSLTTFRVEGGSLEGSCEMPMQVGLTGGAVRAHPAVPTLLRIAGISNARELAGVLVAVGLAQNFAACNALVTVGIQRGHMALHARSVAIAAGIPPGDVPEVVAQMNRAGEVRVDTAERVYRDIRSRRREAVPKTLPVEVASPAKVILFGEHAVVYGFPGIVVPLAEGTTVTFVSDDDGPRFLQPEFPSPFPVKADYADFRALSRAFDVALSMYDLSSARLSAAVKSSVVPGAGLGSSAAFSASLCRACRRVRGLDDDPSAEGLFQEVQQLESIFHGRPSGMDAAAVLSRGVLWFEKGPPRVMDPLVVGSPARGLVCVVEPGASTRLMVDRVRAAHDRDESGVGSILEAIGDTTRSARSAIESGDWHSVGALMFRGHELLANLGVSTPALDQAVERLAMKGVLGAKLTGAGGGGAVIALLPPEEEDEIIAEASEEFPRVYTFSLGFRSDG